MGGITGSFKGQSELKLTERLAQAERERGIYKSQRDASCEHADSLERECAEWKEIAERIRAERDAALAKAESLSTDLEIMYQTANKWKGKADALEAEKDAGWEHLEIKHAELTDLRARIEALAAQWDEQHGAYFPNGSVLRALLQSLKTETALDVLARIEKDWGGSEWHEGGEVLRSDLAKLRKLLTEGGGK